MPNHSIDIESVLELLDVISARPLIAMHGWRPVFAQTLPDCLRVISLSVLWAILLRMEKLVSSTGLLSRVTSFTTGRPLRTYVASSMAQHVPSLARAQRSPNSIPFCLLQQKISANSRFYTTTSQALQVRFKLSLLMSLLISRSGSNFSTRFWTCPLSSVEIVVEIALKRGGVQDLGRQHHSRPP